MGWDNSFQTIITLPSGATVGARIVLDGTLGVILVYDQDNELVDSIAPEDGVDPQGTDYYRGITNYAGDEYVQMGIGNLFLGVRPDPNDPTFDPQPGSMGIIGDSRSMGLQSPHNQDYADTANWKFVAGNISSGIGTEGFPHSSNWRGDIWLGGSSGGALIRSIVPSGQSDEIPETWHVVGDTGEPAFGSGWTSASSSGTYQPLQYRLDAEDNLYLTGVFHATTASPGSGVFTLPDKIGSFPTYRPKIAQRITVSTFATSGTESSASSALVINDLSSGLVRLVSSAAVASGTNFAVSAKIPLGNLP